jgi:spore germination protein KA
MMRIIPEEIKNVLTNVSDVQYRELDCRFDKVYLIFIRSMCDSKRISDNIIRPLLLFEGRKYNIETIMNSVIQSDNIRQLEDIDCTIEAILSGGVVILFSQTGEAVCCKLKGYETRAVDIPQTETVIKGPREGFTEDITTNISEIRRRIKTPALKLEFFYLGSETRTEIVLLYIEDCTPQKLIDYVRDKIKQIENDKTKYVFYANLLENSLKCRFTPFDTIGYTEKPDVAASKLCEGRVLIIMDGNPFVITAPTFFIENFQTTDDYTLNPIMANLGRLFRWTAFFISTFIPGMYLALITYHFKLVPNIFLYRLALFRAGVPVPTVIELIYMIFFFQIIREAGVRLPQPIGPTLSIVGALILGEASVNSGLSSQITVVIVAITSIASYLIPVLHAAIFTWGIGTILLAGFIGLPGFYMGFVLFVAHLAGLTSCGYPYLYPFGTGKSFKHNDIFFRGDLTKNADEPLARK